MSDKPFRSFQLWQAEEALLAACLDHEYALVTAARELGPHPFRSEYTLDLDIYYTWLLNAYLAARYDEQENRARLSARYPNAKWQIEDQLFNGNTSIAAYADDLVMALRETYAAQDRAVAAARFLSETPINLEPGFPVPAPRPSVRAGQTEGPTMRGLYL